MNVKSRLEYHFQKNQKPNAPEITQVAAELGLEKEVCYFKMFFKRILSFDFEFNQSVLVSFSFPIRSFLYLYWRQSIACDGVHLICM